MDDGGGQGGVGAATGPSGLFERLPGETQAVILRDLFEGAPDAMLVLDRAGVIVLANRLFTPWVAGVLLSAILAAIMSTLSCQLLVCSSALTEDFYKGFVRPKASQRELVWFGRAMVLAVSLLAIWIARDPESRVLGLVSYAWAGFGAAFGPVVLFSLFWSRMTRNGALAGMVVGAATVILWKQIAVDQYGSGLYEMVPGFFGASVAIVAASLLDRVPVESVRDTHAQVHAALAEHGY